MLVTNMLILSIVKRTEVETLLERNFHQINLKLNVIFVLYHFLKCYYKVQPIKLQKELTKFFLLNFSAQQPSSIQLDRIEFE